MLGEDLSQDFTLDKIAEAPAYDPEPRRLYREVVERERADHRAAAAAATAGLAAATSSAEPARLVAVCTKGGSRINVHFGHATEFQVYEVDAAGIRFVGHRKVENYCQGGYGDDDRLDGILATLAGIEAVFVAKIGRCPKQDLAKAGIAAIDSYPHDYIETAVAAWYASGLAQHRRGIA
jgi:nitrogen fixation protein NifB